MEKILHKEKSKPASEPEKKDKAPEKKDKPAEKKPAKKGKGRRFKSTSIEHHDDGSHTVRHLPLPSEPADGGAMRPPDDEVSYAAPDHAALQAKLAEHLGMMGGGAGEEPTEPPAAGGAPSPESALQRLATGQ